MRANARRRTRNGLFDLIAPLWDRLAGSLLIDRLTRRLPETIEGPILDLGGGTGRLAERVAMKRGAVAVADLSAPMLRRAHRKGLPAVRTRGESLPFASGAFGAVLVLDALHHMGNLESVARESARVLAPGGVLLLLEPDPDTLFGSLVARAETAIGMGSLLLGAAEMEMLLDEAGLIVSIEHEASHLVVRALKPFAFT